MDSNLTVCVGAVFEAVSPTECWLSRAGAFILVIVSIIAILFNVRFIYWSSHHRDVRSGHYLLIISMVISSMSVIVVIAPSVFVQCFYCRRWCSTFYCRFEGFVNYLNGCVNMFKLMMISIIRYSVVIQPNLRGRFFERYCLQTVLICWLAGLFFAVPPLFQWNEYIPEGVGFHCGLNWFDRSFSSRLYFTFTFAFVYFIPLIVLFAVNIYVYCAIRRLLLSTMAVTRSSLLLSNSDPDGPMTSCTSSMNSSSLVTQIEKINPAVTASLLRGNWSLASRRTLETLHSNQLMRLSRLKADRRFALATTFLISEYLLSWTPYAIIALLYLFDVRVIDQHSVIMTLCAFTAKISMIFNPLIYVATVKTNQLKAMCYCKHCPCSYCREKKCCRIVVSADCFFA